MVRQAPLTSAYTEASDAELRRRISAAKAELGSRLMILGHHYQQDEVIAFADFTGDSLKLSQIAAEQRTAEFIVFCGVHFMAESADILTGGEKAVILPDLTAGCSMADMAHIDQVEAVWAQLERDADQTITPITYVNSSAAVKGFVGQHDGACCTSSNAKLVLEWALHGATADGDPAAGHKVLFLPDQHLGRNTAFALGWPLESMVVVDPDRPFGGVTPEKLATARFLLWKGHCSVHALFKEEQALALRAAPEPWQIIVHPECRWEVCQLADEVGSTEYIIRTVTAAPEGSFWAIGTELHLVNRLAAALPEKRIRSLAGVQCLCSTMYRIDLKHLCWVLEELVRGKSVNRIRVAEETAHWARVALNRMLDLCPAQPLSAR
ncbi:MAG: quinolinate synthase NadA [Phycisphaerales bacterium]|nr:quinolinate synthase NadA [Phycisphaerales bacterium]